MRKKLTLASLFLVAIFALMAAPLAAAAVQAVTGTPPSYDQATVEMILAGFGGITVLGLTQLIKVWTKEKVSPYIISAAVSAVATAVFLVRTGGFTLIAFAGYAVFVFATANGIYKATKTS